MMKTKLDYEREKMILDQGIGLIEDFNDHFVAYNTRFLGWNFDGDYVINGENTSNSYSLDEFCFGYDVNQELHLLHVHQTKKGQKYAATEVSYGTYAFWEIIEDPIISERNRRNKRRKIFRRTR